MVGRTLGGLLVALTVPSLAQDRPMLGPKDGTDLQPMDLDRVSVGVAAPDFTLEALDGSHITLSDHRGRMKVVLVFYRGHW